MATTADFLSALPGNMQRETQLWQVKNSLEIVKKHNNELRKKLDLLQRRLGSGDVLDLIIDRDELVQDWQRTREQIRENEKTAQQLRQHKENVWDASLKSLIQGQAQALTQQNQLLQQVMQQEREVYVAHLKAVQEQQRANSPVMLEELGDMQSRLNSFNDEARLRMMQEYLMQGQDTQQLMTEQGRLLLQYPFILGIPTGDAVNAGITQDNSSPTPKLDLTAANCFVRKALPASLKDSKSTRLVGAMAFSSSGEAIVAVCEDGFHKYWQYCPFFSCVEPSCRQPGYSPVERLWSWHAVGGAKMKVDMQQLSQTTPKAVIVSNNQFFMLSLVGGAVFLFNLKECEFMTLVHKDTKAATAIAFHHTDCNVIAMGLADGTLALRNVQQDNPTRQEKKLHGREITSVVFCAALSYVVTAGCDGKLVVLKLDEKDKTIQEVVKELALHPTAGPDGRYVDYDEVHMELLKNGTQLLVSHPNQISIYNLKTFTRIVAWSAASLGPQWQSLQVGSARYATGGTYVYATFVDGSVMVFKTEGLKVICRFVPDVVDPQSPGVAVKLLVPHPQPQYFACFALAMTDGSVQIWKPAKGPNAKWEDVVAEAHKTDTMAQLASRAPSPLSSPSLLANPLVTLAPLSQPLPIGTASPITNPFFLSDPTFNPALNPGLASALNPALNPGLAFLSGSPALNPFLAQGGSGPASDPLTNWTTLQPAATLAAMGLGATAPPPKTSITASDYVGGWGNPLASLPLNQLHNNNLGRSTGKPGTGANALNASKNKMAQHQAKHGNKGSAVYKRPDPMSDMETPFASASNMGRLAAEFVDPMEASPFAQAKQQLATQSVILPDQDAAQLFAGGFDAADKNKKNGNTNTKKKGRFTIKEDDPYKKPVDVLPGYDAEDEVDWQEAAGISLFD